MVKKQDKSSDSWDPQTSGVPKGALERFFTLRAKPPRQSEAFARFGINKEELLYELSLTMRQGVIEPYQAALILVASLNLPVQKDGNTHPLQLISLHNDTRQSFAAKTDRLLHMAMGGGITYPDLCKAGFMNDPKQPGSIRPLFNLLYPEKDQHPAADRKPKHTRGIRRREKVKRDGLQSDLIQKTFSAIPKSRMLSLLSRAVNANTIGFEQIAMIIAVNSHSLETRDSGQRYLDHIMAVAADTTLTKTQKVIALLHDVLENSNLTIEDFRAVRMPKEIIASLEAITIKTEIDPATCDARKEPYLEFIRRVAKDRDASAVKVADIHHNMQDAPPARRTKYHLALGYLEAVKANFIDPKSISVEEWAEIFMPDELATYNRELAAKAAREKARLLSTHAEESFDPPEEEPPSKRKYLTAVIAGLFSTEVGPN